MAAASQPSAGQTMDLRSYAKAFWRWRVLFLVVALLVPGGAYALAKREANVYRAKTTLLVGPSVVDTSLFSNFTDSSSSDTTPQTLATLAGLIKTTGVAQEAAKHLSPRPANPRSLLGLISTAANTDTNFIVITASGPTPSAAADVANAFGQAVVARRTQAARATLDSAIRQIQSQLAALSPADTTGRRQLSQQLQRFRALKAAQGQNAKIIESAVPPSTPVSPRPMRTTLLGLILGILLAGAAVVVAESLDRRIRAPGELEELSGLPLLAVIPKSAFEVSPGDRGRAGDAFATLRATLTYFNVERELTSLIVTSPGIGDGKTTVAANLAIAMTEAGKHVILVDADLRRPRVGELFGVAGPSGLGGVLSGTEELDTALHAPAVGNPAGGRLEVLPAGSLPPNPAELLGSERMRLLIDRLKVRADIVIIDTPPVLVVSDAIPLLENASGVVLVARLNGTRREPLSRLKSTVTDAHGMPLGVVATNAKSSRLYGYEDYSAEPSVRGLVGRLRGRTPRDPILASPQANGNRPAVNGGGVEAGPREADVPGR